MILNFDCKLVTKKKTISIKNNVVSTNDRTKTENNQLIEIYLKTIEKEFKNKIKTLKSSDFDTYLEEAKYLQEAYTLLLSLKEDNCDYRYRYSKTYEDFKERIDGFFSWRNLEVTNKKPTTNYIEDLILHTHADQIFSFPYTEKYFTEECYNPIKNVYLHEDLKQALDSFNFKKYKVHKSVKTTFMLDYKRYQNDIKMFQATIKEFGNELAKWSDAKISRYYTAYGSWDIKSWTKTYRNHLIATGVKTNTKEKPIEKSWTKFQNNKADNSDLIRIFKTGTVEQVSKVIEGFNKDAILSILKDTTKVCQKRVDEYSLQISRKFSDFVKTKEDMELLLLTNPLRRKILPLKYFLDKENLLTSQQVITLGERFSELPQEILEKHIAPQPFEVRYNISPQISEYFLAQATESEALKFLEHYGGLDAPQDLTGYYENIEYSKIRPRIRRSDHLLETFLETIVKEKDRKMALKLILLNKSSYQVSKIAEKAFTILDFKTKISLLNKIPPVADAFTDDECLTIFSKCLTSDFLTKKELCKPFIKRCLENRNNLKSLLNTVIRDSKKIINFPRVEDIYLAEDCLEKPTRLFLAKQEIYPKGQKDDYRYRSFNWRRDKEFYNYFKDFQRRDIEYVFGKNFLDILTLNQAAALFPILTQEERLHLLGMDLNVLRRYNNLDYMNYTFLKQFEEKQKFKSIVGDCRNRENKSFGERLIKALNISNSEMFINWLSE